MTIAIIIAAFVALGLLLYAVRRLPALPTYAQVTFWISLVLLTGVVWWLVTRSGG